MRLQQIQVIKDFLVDHDPKKHTDIFQVITSLDVEALAEQLFESDLHELKKLLNPKKMPELVLALLNLSLEIKRKIKIDNGLSADTGSDNSDKEDSRDSDSEDSFDSEEILVKPLSIKNSFFPDEAFIQIFFDKNLLDDIHSVPSLLLAAKKIESGNLFSEINLSEVLQRNCRENQLFLQNYIRELTKRFCLNFDLYDELTDFSGAIANHIEQFMHKQDSKFGIMLYRNPSFFKDYLASKFYFERMSYECLSWLNYEGKITCNFDPVFEILIQRAIALSERKIPSFVVAVKNLIYDILRDEQLLSYIGSDMTQVDWKLLFECMENSRILHDKIALLRQENNICKLFVSKNDSPLDFVQEILRRENVDYTKEMVATICDEMSSVLAKDESYFEKLLTDVNEWIRAICNRLELSKLHAELSKQVDEKTADRVLSDWQLLGDDIRMNRRVLTVAEQESIVRHVKQQFSEAEIQRDLMVLQQQLSSNELPALPEVSMRKFPRLFRGAEGSSGTNIDLVLNRALIHQHIRSPQKNQPNFIEIAVFKCFELPVRDLKKLRNEVHQKFMLILNTLEDRELTKSTTFQQLKSHILDLQCQSRYLAIGGDQKYAQCIPVLVKRLTENYQVMKQRWAKLQTQDIARLLDIDSLRDHPQKQKQLSQILLNQFAKLLEGIYRDFIAVIVKNVTHCMTGNNPKILEEELNGIFSDEACNELLSKYYQQQLQRFQVTVELQAKIYEKYSGNLVVEMIQGLDDEQEILIDGVCEAVSVRVARYLEDNPSAELSTNMREHLQVKPFDRFFQSSYRVYARLDRSVPAAKKNETLVPEKIAARYGSSKFETRFSFLFQANLMTPVDVFAKLKTEYRNEIQGYIDSGCGVFLLSLYEEKDGHETVLIVDEKNNRYGFFDCNFGLFRFSSASSSKQDAFDQAIDCAVDVLKTYDAIKLINLTQNTSSTSQPLNVSK